MLMLLLNNNLELKKNTHTNIKGLEWWVCVELYTDFMFHPFACLLFCVQHTRQRKRIRRQKQKCVALQFTTPKFLLLCLARQTCEGFKRKQNSYMPRQQHIACSPHSSTYLPPVVHFHYQTFKSSTAKLWHRDRTVMGQQLTYSSCEN